MDDFNYDPIVYDTTTSGTTTSGTTQGGGSTLGSIFDTIKYGVGIWSDEQQRQAQEQAGQDAITLERLRLQQEIERRKLEEGKGSGLASKIKAYGIPLAIAGVFIVGGISAYWYFKKKKA
jgi:GAF domain-containing protein